MNILLIAPYRTYSGWGEGGKHLAKSLNTLDHNLAIRPIYMSNEIEQDFNDEELLELECASYDHYDIVIQRVLPQFFRRVPYSKSVLACVFETSNIRSTPWWRYLNNTDAILVPSQYEKQDLLNSDIKPPIHNVSEAIDTAKYKKDYTPIPELEGTFNFYFIGEFVERKNIKALLTAFHREFRPNEPVKLVIKTLGNPQVIHKEIQQIKSHLRIYQSLGRYKQEVLICGRLPEEQMHNLHRSCHCMVMPSYGEAYCRPVVDALGYGNTPIVTNNTGMTDYINNRNGWIVDSRVEPVYTTQPPLSDIYTAKENWSNINIQHLMMCMREHYSSTDLQQTLKAHGDSSIQQFSYKNIGQKIEKALNGIAN